METNSKKTIYFLRHGQTDSNVKVLVQGASEPLSEIGQQQAQFLGQRLSSLNFENIIASSDLRAAQTAKIANEKLGKTLELSDLFVERRNPSSLIGKEALGEEVQEIYKQIRANAADHDWHYEDEENFNDVRTRAVSALKLLIERPETSLAVFTHGNFLSVMLGVIIFGENITQETWGFMRQSIELSNTGVTICEYFYNYKATGQGKWRILTVNDHAHLADLVEELPEGQK